MHHPKVVVTMPAYEAARTLEATVRALPEDLVGSLIVVDDASRDDTVSVAERLGLRVVVHPNNRGYGGNQKTCYATALQDEADIVVLLHPDHQYDPRMVPLLIAPILSGDADMTFGSRFAGLSDPLAGGMPVYRFVGNRLTTLLQNVALGARFTEMHSGMRAYSRSCLLALPFLSYSDDFDFDSRLLTDAIVRGMNVIEVPIPTRYTIESSSISIARSLRYIGNSVGYAVGQSVQHGRRATRSPVAGKQSHGRRLGQGPLLRRSCDLCGHERQTLVYPANVLEPPTVDEFVCTAGLNGRHDDVVQCRACSLVASVPRLDPSELIARYRETHDVHYLSEEASRRESFRWILSMITAYHLEGRRLLDVGAHSGLFLDEARHAGFEVSGLEPSRSAAENARRLGLGVTETPVEALEDRNVWDVLTMFDVLEHVFSPRAALTRVREAMAPGGLLALTTTNVDSPHARARGEDWPWFLRAHIHHFSPATLRRYLETCGFRLVELRTVHRSFHLSYLSERSAPAASAVADLAARSSEVWDPKIPTRWLGDVVLAIARPKDPVS